MTEVDRHIRLSSGAMRRIHATLPPDRKRNKMLFAEYLLIGVLMVSPIVLAKLMGLF